MTAITYVIGLLFLGQAWAGVVELNCSDNATCIEDMAKEFVSSVRQRKTVKLFDVLTVEPLPDVRQGRSNDGLLSKFLSGHAFTYDWNDLSFRVYKPQGRDDILDLEVYETRAAKDVSEKIPKKSKSKADAEEEDDGDKVPKVLTKRRPFQRPEDEDTIINKISRRRQKRKILQAVIPMLVGMKSTGTVIFAMSLVTALVLKAFIVSKLALAVTMGMALKRLYDNYSLGIGLQNNPYLFSQYPIDFPSASSHAYSVSGVSQPFASPEMYNPSALAQHSHAHELLQQPDASAQQSQQAPTLQLVNGTRAAERWDGYQRRPIFYGHSRATSESYSGFQQLRH